EAIRDGLDMATAGVEGLDLHDLSHRRIEVDRRASHERIGLILMERECDRQRRRRVRKRLMSSESPRCAEPLNYEEAILVGRRVARSGLVDQMQTVSNREVGVEGSRIGSAGADVAEPRMGRAY